MGSRRVRLPNNFRRWEAVYQQTSALGRVLMWDTPSNPAVRIEPFAAITMPARSGRIIITAVCSMVLVSVRVPCTTITESICTSAKS
jgi:hypothetical protein